MTIVQSIVRLVIIELPTLTKREAHSVYIKYSVRYCDNSEECIINRNVIIVRTIAICV